MTEEYSREDESDGKGGKGGPDRPPARREKERDERGDRAQANAAQRQADARHPDGSEHLAQDRTYTRGRRDAAKARDQRQDGERQQHRRERDREEAIARVQG